MNITITPTVRIDKDFTVQLLHTVKEGARAGQQVWRDESFNGSLADALTNVIKRNMVSGEDRIRVERVLAKLRAACKAVDNACDGFITGKEAAKIEGRMFGNFPESFWS